ncbi:hypothetical protein HMPREF9069_01079 [Atopobium sp. oral taxon 810 str. F0209]|nr:hypothetical protein HMPREF9069_01079 [Atopobium sp. oral taxon 810 str. F0209]
MPSNNVYSVAIGLCEQMQSQCIAACVAPYGIMCVSKVRFIHSILLVNVHVLPPPPPDSIMIVLLGWLGNSISNLSPTCIIPIYKIMVK